MLILLLVVLLLFLSAFIEYPEVVRGEAFIKPLFSILNFYAAPNSRIFYQSVKDGDIVKKGDLLFVLEKDSSQAKNQNTVLKDSLYSTMDARVVIQHLLKKNEYFQDSLLILSLVPLERHYTATISLGKTGTGQIQIGQKAYISLYNFPKSEYGELTGLVGARPSYNNDSSFIDIELVNGSNSTFKKDLSIYTNSVGVGEITVSEKKLYKRIFSFLQ